MNKKASIILDTDIGYDVDDAGALGLLHILSKRKNSKILAVTNCTSNPYGNGAIDVINRAFGKKNIPVGMYDKPDFLCGKDGEKYNKALCLNYENRYKINHDAPPALKIIKEALQSAEDDSVVMITIGPLNNFADLLKDDEGRGLAFKKIKIISSMCCCFTGADWNIKTDIISAKYVFDYWNAPMIVSPWETGHDIITGVFFNKLCEEHPLRIAYRLYNDGIDGIGRSSWDLTSVWAALMGPEPFFSLSESHTVKIADTGETIYKPDPDGNVRFLIKKMDPSEIGTAIDDLWE